MRMDAKGNLETLSKLHPADIADALQRLEDPQKAVALLRKIPQPLSSEAFAELEPEFIQDLSTLLSEEELAKILQRLPHNDSTDIVGELPESRQRELLDELPSALASPLRTLLQYPEDSAGGIMRDDYLTLDSWGSVSDAFEKLRKAEQEDQSVSYLYVVDSKGHLAGVLSFRDLVLSRQNIPLIEITNPNVKRLSVHDDQEEIARQFAHYHFLALPVVDEMGKLVGIVEARDALEIAREEATEDMQLMVGVSGEEQAWTPWHRAIGKRLPWLFVNLATAFAAASIVAFYEGTIAEWPLLAVFIPIIAGQGGNAGMQTLTIIIRNLALGELNPGDGCRALMKEIYLALANGFAIGFVVGWVAFLWQKNHEHGLMLGFVVGIAMILNQITAALAGVLIPFTLKALRIDPALASSIFLTTATDVGGFFFFLWLASFALKNF